MTLIIRDQLVNPPTWLLSFRDLTLYCSIFLQLDIIVESDDIDAYYKWLRPRGGLDFIAQFVRRGEEDGLRLDIEHAFAPTVVTDRITPENTHQLLRRIQFARK